MKRCNTCIPEIIHLRIVALKCHQKIHRPNFRVKINIRKRTRFITFNYQITQSQFRQTYLLFYAGKNIGRNSLLFKGFLILIQYLFRTFPNPIRQITFSCCCKRHITNFEMAEINNQATMFSQLQVIPFPNGIS